MLKNSLWLLLCSLCLPAFAQQDSTTIANKISVLSDTLNYKGLRYDGFRTGVEVGVFTHGLFAKDIVTYYTDVRKFEVTADAGFNNNKFFMVADLGFGDVYRTRLGVPDEFTYKNLGGYLRIGADYNVMRRYFNNEVLFVGLRYGYSVFRHKVAYRVPTELWGQLDDRKQLVISPGIPWHYLSGHWAEAVSGLKVNVWRNWFMGYTLRLKVKLGINGETNLIANELPGYGTTNKSARLAFSYYIYYHFPYRKLPAVIVD